MTPESAPPSEDGEWDADDEEDQKEGRKPPSSDEEFEPPAMAGAHGSGESWVSRRRRLSPDCSDLRENWVDDGLASTFGLCTLTFLGGAGSMDGIEKSQETASDQGGKRCKTSG